MQKIIYVTKFYCELCKKERPVHLYGDIGSSFTSDDEPELIVWAKHYHWIDFHRVCAVCGKIVKSGDLELAFNDGNMRIHTDYTDEYKKVSQSDRGGHLLIIHTGCVKDSSLSHLGK